MDTILGPIEPGKGGVGLLRTGTPDVAEAGSSKPAGKEAVAKPVAVDADKEEPLEAAGVFVHDKIGVKPWEACLVVTVSSPKANLAYNAGSIDDRILTCLRPNFSSSMFVNCRFFLFKLFTCT